MLAAIATQTVPGWGVDWFDSWGHKDLPAISGTGPLLQFTVGLINFVKLCVPAMCLAPCWPCILTALFRGRSLATHLTPCCFYKASETPWRVRSSFQEFWENVLQNYEIHDSKYYLRNCQLERTGLGAGNRKWNWGGGNLWPSENIQQKLQRDEK